MLENEDRRYKDWVLFKRVLVHLKPYSSFVALAILLLLVVSILNLAGPYLTKVVLPDPISPTLPSVLPQGIVISIFFKTSWFSPG